jgi:hypothetical protein
MYFRVLAYFLSRYLSIEMADDLKPIRYLDRSADDPPLATMRGIAKNCQDDNELQGIRRTYLMNGLSFRSDVLPKLRKSFSLEA